MTDDRRRPRADQRDELGRARDAEVKRLDTLLAAWDILTGKGNRRARTALAATLEKTGESGILTSPTLRALLEEASRNGRKNLPLHALEVLQDPAWPTIVRGVAEREAARYVAKTGRGGSSAPGDEPLRCDAAWEEQQAEAEGLAPNEWRQRQAESFALSRVIADHRTLEEIARENRIGVPELVEWLDRALAHRRDIPADSWAEWTRRGSSPQSRRRNLTSAEKRPTAAAALPMADLVEDDARRAEAEDAGGFDVAF